MSYWGGQDTGGQGGAYWNANSAGGGGSGGFGANGGDWNRGGGSGGGFGANGGDWNRGGGGGGGGGGFGGANSYDRGSSMEIEIERTYVGRVIGRGGAKIRELENESGARIKVYSDRSNGVMTPIELIGSEDAQMHAKQLIDELCSQNYGQGGAGGGSGGAGRQSGGGGGGGGGGGASYEDSGPPLEIDIDSKDVGRVIGRGGSKIRELQDKSGARIQIYKDRSNGVTTPIELRGSDSAKLKAKAMIESLCEAMQQY